MEDLVANTKDAVGFVPSDYGIHITAAQERFSSAYVKLMCAAAKINYSEPKTDNESIDIEFIGCNFRGKWKRPRILAQLKCTSDYTMIDMKKQELKFSLSMKNYNDLREKDDLPKILIVVFCPENNNEWVETSSLQAKVRFSGYWVSIEGFPEVSNKERVTVRVPFSQPFDNNSLIELMENYSERGFLSL